MMATKAVTQFTVIAMTIYLLVQSIKNEGEKKRTKPRRLPIGIHITSINTASITHTVNPGQRGGTLTRGPGQRIRNPTQCNHITRIQTRHHEHHGNVSRRHFSRARGDDERCDGNVQREGNVQVAFARAVGVPGVGEGADDGETIGGCG